MTVLAWLPDHQIEADLVATIACDGDRRHLLEHLDPDLFASHATLVRALAAAHRTGTLHRRLEPGVDGLYVWDGVDPWCSARLNTIVAGAGLTVTLDVNAAVGRLRDAHTRRQIAFGIEAAHVRIAAGEHPDPEQLDELRRILQEADA